MNIKHLLFLFLFIQGLNGINTLRACELWELSVKKSACTGEKFYVTISFNYKDASNCFTVTGNGKNYGTYDYTKLPIVIDGLVGDCTTNFEFQMTDCNYKQCYVSQSIGTVCCVTPPPCTISNLRLEKQPCDTNNKFAVLLNFNHENTSTCFKLKINDHLYGQFDYASLPIRIGPLEGDCITDRVFAVYDCLKPDDCNAKIGLDKVCCNHECKISNIKIEKTGCDSLNMFIAVLSFKAENVSDSFILKINDRIFGKFKYGNSAYKVGPLPGDCVTKFRFLLIDNKNTQCATDTLWGPVCCGTPPEPCHLTELDIKRTDCDTNNQFYVNLNFKNNNSSDWFKIFIAGVHYGDYKYTDLPLHLGPFNGDCKTEYAFLIKDGINPDCRLEYSFGTVCCGTPPPHCQLSDLNITKGNCNADNQFYVSITFVNHNSSECFNLYVNNDLYGQFKYADLPVTQVGPFKGDCTTEYVFLVKDCVNPDCRIDKSIGKVCCPAPPPCLLSDMLITKTDCDSNNQFKVIVNFKTKDSTGCFHIYTNGYQSGEFKYSSLPVTIGPFNGDCHTEYNFLVKDCANPDCHLEKSIGTVCCPNNPPPHCQLSDLNITKGNCNADNQFYVSITFVNHNSSECFNLYVNNDLYGQFKYADLPITQVGPFKGDCTTEYVFLVKDCVNPDCRIDKSIGKVCCGTPPEPCHLSELVVTKGDCDSLNQFFVTINFVNKNASGCFHLYVNNDLYGEYKYTDLPLHRVGPFKGDCHTVYNFLVKDCVNPDCHIDQSIGTVCCGTPPPHCQLSDLNITKGDCNSDNQFNVSVGFVNHNSSECFNLYVNNDLYGQFKYADLPITRVGPFKGDCTTEYVFLVKDCVNPDCRIDKSIGKVCCPAPPPCLLSDMLITKTDCDSNNQFKVIVNFKTKDSTGCFHIYTNGSQSGEFKYSSLPVTIGPYNGDCHTEYNFVVRDCANPDCHLEKSIGTVCCGNPPPPCLLSDLNVKKEDCGGDNLFFVDINFHYSGVSDCFHVTGNGHNYGEFRYGQLPIRIGPLLGDCITNYEFGIQDCAKHDCHISAQLGKVCCDTTNYKYYDFEMTRTDCEPDSTFKVKFNFHYRDVSDSFNILINGKSFGTYGYNQLPVSAGPLFADCKTIYRINLTDQKDTAIRITRFIERPCCHPNFVPCSIYDVKASPQKCTGPNEYELILNFKYKGTTNQFFDVFDRNGPIGYFPFASLPITLEHFKQSGREFDYVNICENDNPKCCTPIEFRTIKCDSLVNNPGKFKVTDLVVYTNTSSNSVSLFSQIEFPDGIEIEMFNLEGKQVPVDRFEKQLHEIIIYTNLLTTDMYFIRIKSQDSTKTYKFFHIR